MVESADHIVKLCPFLNAPCLGDACINHTFVEGHIGFCGRYRFEVVKMMEEITYGKRSIN